METYKYRAFPLNRTSPTPNTAPSINIMTEDSERSFRKRSKLADLGGFSALKSRYVPSLGSRDSDDLKLSPTKSPHKLPSRSPQNSETVSPSKRNANKINYLTDLEISQNIEALANNGAVLKSLLLSVTASVKASKSELSELAAFSKQNNEDIAALVRSLDAAQALSDKIEALFEKVSARDQSAAQMDRCIAEVSNKIETLAPTLEKIEKSSFSEARETEMVYSIIKASRAESASVLRQIAEWKTEQQRHLKSMEAKLGRSDPQSGFLLLNNIGQVIGEQLHLSNGKLKNVLSGISDKINELSKAVEAGAGMDKAMETIEKKLDSQSRQIDYIQRAFEKGVTESVVERVVAEKGDVLLDERLKRWSSQVDKNISQLLISLLTLKFQGALAATIKETLRNEMGGLSNGASVTDSDLLTENRNLKRKLKELESGDRKAEELEHRVKRLQEKKEILHQELANLKGSYIEQYDEYKHLQKKHAELMERMGGSSSKYESRRRGAVLSPIRNQASPVRSPKARPLPVRTGLDKENA